MANYYNNFTGSNMLLSQDDYINQTANRARAQYDAALNSTKRNAARMGINPNSGSYMAMLNNAQYDQTAGLNAATSDASFKWLNAAQEQFNNDRNYNLRKQSIDQQNSQFYDNLNLNKQKEIQNALQQINLLKFSQTQDKAKYDEIVKILGL